MISPIFDAADGSLAVVRVDAPPARPHPARRRCRLVGTLPRGQRGNLRSSSTSSFLLRAGSRPGRSDGQERFLSQRSAQLDASLSYGTPRAVKEVPSSMRPQRAARGGIWRTMEIVLVGAPGSGARIVGRLLAERMGARFVDLTGEPARAHRPVRPAASPSPAGGARSARYRGRPHPRRSRGPRTAVPRAARHLAGRPADRLVERLRAARRQDIGIEGDIRTFTTDHLAEYRPYYLAGDHVDASGSTSPRRSRRSSRSSTIRRRPGPLVLRADVRGGLMELGDGILAGA